jgi:hypothetical protein
LEELSVLKHGTRFFLKVRYFTIQIPWKCFDDKERIF